MQQTIRSSAQRNIIQPQLKKNRLSWKKIKSQKCLVFMSIPFLLWLFIFKYIPLWGWTMAFQQYMPGKSFFEQKWVGVKYFISMFKDDLFYNAMRNTLAMSLLSLAFGFTLPIILAILINEIKGERFKKSVQTISYLPHFVSWVIVASIFNKLLTTDSGVVNNILVGLHITEEPIQFMAKPELFWWIVTFAMCEELGWNSIIFCGYIQVFHLIYESAMVTVLPVCRRIWQYYRTRDSSPVMVILIMSIGNLINTGFERHFYEKFIGS